MKNLKDDYPDLKHFHNEDTLAEVKERQGVESLSQLLRKLDGK
jgi:hypothetical protein